MSDSDDVSLVAVVAVLGQVHDPVMVVVALGPVHNDLLRAPPMPHNYALKIEVCSVFNSKHEKSFKQKLYIESRKKH